MTTDQEVVQLLCDALEVLAHRAAPIIGTDAATEVVLLGAAARQAVGLSVNPEILTRVTGLRTALKAESDA